MNPEKQSQLAAAEAALVEWGKVNEETIARVLDNAMIHYGDLSPSNMRDFLIFEQGRIANALIEAGEMDLFRTFRTLLNLWFHAKADALHEQDKGGLQ